MNHNRHTSEDKLKSNASRTIEESGDDAIEPAGHDSFPLFIKFYLKILLLTK
jgi:hypothetical protein